MTRLTPLRAALVVLVLLAAYAAWTRIDTARQADGYLECVVATGDREGCR